MVKVCSKTYPKKNEEEYKEHFEMFNYPLSDFQKHAIEAIVTGNHALICSGTGNGKTLPSEFAIHYFTKRRKKVIYTSPIKALSNQKYYDFQQKYPHISFALLTGDIKINPEADVLIMTAEILQNTLYRKKNDTSTNPALLSFDMDFENELACVVHDEVHSINMEDRGHVWESIFMLLPGHVQNVMLSATLDSPDKFALWCETVSNTNLRYGLQKKEVYLTTLAERVVPLVHYSFITSTQGIFKAIKKDEVLQKEIKDIINKPFVLQNEKGKFDDIHYHKMKKMLNLFEEKNIYMKRSFVLNQVCKYMVEHNLLPCACFILSRKQLETAAREITVPLLEDDSKVPYTIRRECEQIVRSKLSNFQEYLELPEYLSMVSLLEKGIATHHSGTLPILKEIVELLFAKGYIKLLFATETFSCGLNMPIKTVIFTDVNKFDGHGFRILYGHEYVQAGGRAGRRGLDTIGHVIHLNNLFKSTELTEYKNMMQGKPQKLVSKFKISYNLILNLIDIGDQNFLEFAKRSMIQQDIDSELGGIYYQMSELENEIQNLEVSLQNLRTPKNIIKHYIHLTENKNSSVNKKRKEMEREVQTLLDEYKNIENDKKTYSKYSDKCIQLEELRKQFKGTENYLNNNITKILDFLGKEDFISKEETDTSKYKLNYSGLIATHLREIHCLAFAKLIKSKKIDDMSASQIISLFSCFTNVTVSEELQSIVPNTNDKTIKSVIKDIVKLFDDYQKFETNSMVNTGMEYLIHYDLLNYMEAWCNCESVQDCKYLLQNIEKEKGIFLGEFVKAILKINNISSEMEKIAETIGNISLLSKLRDVPTLTMKFVATNQSLYI